MGEGGSSVDLTEATTALTDMKDALIDWVGEAAPMVAAIAGGFLVFYLIRYVVRLVKSASK